MPGTSTVQPRTKGAVWAGWDLEVTLSAWCTSNPSRCPARLRDAPRACRTSESTEGKAETKDEDDVPIRPRGGRQGMRRSVRLGD